MNPFYERRKGGEKEKKRGKLNILSFAYLIMYSVI